jgi:hypothetical protein
MAGVMLLSIEAAIGHCVKVHGRNAARKLTVPWSEFHHGVNLGRTSE